MTSRGRGRLSRRALLNGAAAGLATTITGTSRAAGALAVELLSDSVTLISGPGGNQLAVETDAGLVLVDSGRPADADDFEATLAEVSRQPVTALFNTHWHPEQVGSNARLGDRGATIHAHEKTRQRLAAGYYLEDEDRYQPALAAAGVPTVSFYDQSTTEIGGTAIESGYLIEAHTDGDIFVAFPAHNTIAVGGVLAPDRDPEFDWFGGGWLGGRLDSLDLLLEISNATTRFVPAFGPVVDRAGLTAERDMYQTIFDRIVERIRLGEAARDMLEAGVLDGLGREFADPFRLLYDLQKGFWAHHNKLMHDIV